MNDNGHPLDRRRLLAGAAAASAVTLTGLAVATTGAAAAAPTRTVRPLVTRDRIGAAALRAPDGAAPAVRIQADFHARLTAWLAFWSANSPARGARRCTWSPGSSRPATRWCCTRSATAATTNCTPASPPPGATPRTWPPWPACTTTSRACDSGRTGPSGRRRARRFTGAPEQAAFAVAACRELWGDAAATAGRWPEHAGRVLARAGQPADAASHTGWAAFTRISLRRGLGTESYE